MHVFPFFFLLTLTKFSLFPYTTLFRSQKSALIRSGNDGTLTYSCLCQHGSLLSQHGGDPATNDLFTGRTGAQDRKSTRLNSSHVAISYAVFCLKKKNTISIITENYNIN